MTDLQSLTLAELRESLFRLMTPTVPAVDSLEGAAIKQLTAEIDKRMTEAKRRRHQAEIEEYEE